MRVPVCAWIGAAGACLEDRKYKDAIVIVGAVSDRKSDSRTIGKPSEGREQLSETMAKYKFCELQNRISFGT